MTKEAKAKAVELINFFTPLIYDGEIELANLNEVQLKFAKTCSMKVVIEQINEGRLLGNYRAYFWQMVYDYIKEYDGEQYYNETFKSV